LGYLWPEGIGVPLKNIGHCLLAYALVLDVVAAPMAITVLAVLSA